MQKKKHLLFSFILVAFLFSAISQGFGQLACVPVSQYQDSPYWRASLVFTGVVNKFVADNPPVSSNLYYVTDTYTPVFNVVKFSVEKTYRGNVKDEIEIISSFNFKEGERYFVYASPGNDGKIFQLDNGLCGRQPILLRDAKDDIEYAEEVESGKIGTRIFGSVTEDRWRLWELRRNVPLANVEVTIKSKKYSFTTKTDEQGKFVFKNIPPAVYTIVAETPKGMHQRPFPMPNTVSLGERIASNGLTFVRLGSNAKPKYEFRHWDYHNFLFTSLSSIEGKVVGIDGKTPSLQFISLLPFDKDGRLRFDDRMQGLRKDSSTGRFVFENIPAGKYRIAINPLNCHAVIDPEFGRTFFPGVSEESEAGTITVGENESIKLSDFRLLLPLKERKFSGVVLAADRKPLANATVFMFNKNVSNPGECFSISLETKTDESGHFLLKGYEGYEYKIRAYTQPTGQSSSRLFSRMLELPRTGTIEDINLVVDSSN